MFNSIRWRIAFPMVALIFVSMLILGVYLSKYIEKSYLNVLKRQMATQARIVAEVSPLEWNREGEDDFVKYWATILGERITLITIDGVVIGELKEDRKLMDNHSNRPEVIDALETGEGSSIRFSHTTGYDMLYTAVRIPQGILRLSAPLNTLKQDIVRLQRTLVEASLLAAFLAALFAIWIAGRISRPVKLLTNAAQQMAAGQPITQPMTSSLEEIDRLTHAFNSMAVQIKNQFNEMENESDKLSAVLNHMTDGVIMVDKNGIIQLMNPAAEKMFETSTLQALGHSLMETLRRHQLYELWQKSIIEGVDQQASFTFSRHLVIQVAALPLGQSLPDSTLLLFQNITHQKKIEAVRRDFISNVSHELRTPLAALKALTETLRDGALEDPPAARRFLARMESEVDELNLMVSELLELARIESGRVPLDLHPSPPHEIIHAAFERLVLQAERAGLNMVINCEKDLPLVMVDKNRIQQVIVNLMHNAIKFTSVNGQVTAGAALQGDKVVFFVRDTGVGIDSAELSRIFERFYKVDQARSSSGTGLGLAIVRHMVEAHGGTIWAESELGKGSTFYFTLVQSQS